MPKRSFGSGNCAARPTCSPVAATAERCAARRGDWASPRRSASSSVRTWPRAGEASAKAQASAPLQRIKCPFNLPSVSEPRDAKRAGAHARARPRLPVSRPGDQETKGLGGAMSGGASMVAYRTDIAGIADKTVSVPTTCNAGTSATGAADAQALRQADASIASPQQSSAAGPGWLMLPMLSHGAAIAAVQAVATGPTASQTVRRAAMKIRNLMADA